MITLSSTNPKFSWILRKNPETQRTDNVPFSRDLRKGTLHGWFTDDQTFKLLFIDSTTESSFNTISDFEYLDRTRFSSPYLPIAAISTLLASAQKEKTEEDVEGFTSSLECVSEISINIANRLIGHIPCEINMEQIASKTYKIKFVSDKGLFHLLNCVISFMIIQAIQDDNLYIPMEEAVVKKYLSALNVTDAGYYARHIFALKCIRSPKVFESLQDSMNQGKFKLGFGTSQDHRWNSIKERLVGGDQLYDIGVGECFYEKRLNRHYGSIIGFEADDDTRDHAERIVKNRFLENVEILPAFDPGYTFNTSGHDVLMTEVLEHMEQENSEDLLKHVLSSDFRKVVVTVPNKNFNVFYGLSETDIRHHDHKWEPTSQQFVSWINGILFDLWVKHINVEFFNIGNEVLVNGQWVASGVGAVFTKSEN